MPPMTPAIHEGVRHAESLIDIYPKHFPNIEAAKAYVVQTCGLDLADVDSDKIAFLVGIKAFQAGEFYLDLAPPNRKVLRDAIESAISILLPQIRTWPPWFLHVGEAKTYVAMSVRGLISLTFPGVEDETFQGYALFNTARHTWEERRFEMRVVPQGWKRIIAPTPMAPLSLTAAVELNISRLQSLLCTWPPYFTDLNAARDYVQNVCYAKYFRYTYHADVEKVKFRLYVHFNTAKYALRDGKFIVNTIGEPKRSAGIRPVMVKNFKPVEAAASVESDGTLVTGEEERIERFKVSTAAYGPSRNKAATFVRTSYEEFRNRASGAVLVVGPDKADVYDDDRENNPPLSPTDSMEPLMAVDEAAKIAHEQGREKVVESDERVDPFKALVAELRREFILKAAFD